MINRSIIELCLRRNSGGGYYNVVNNTSYSFVNGSSLPYPSDYKIRPECTIDLRSGETGINLNSYKINNKTICFWIKDTSTYSGNGGVIFSNFNLMIKNNTLYILNAPASGTVTLCSHDFTKWTFVEIYAINNGSSSVKNITLFINGTKIGTFTIYYNNTWDYYGESIKYIGYFSLGSNKFNFNGILSDVCIINGRYHTDGYKIPSYYLNHSLYDNIKFYLLYESNDNIYG